MSTMSSFSTRTVEPPKRFSNSISSRLTNHGAKGELDDDESDDLADLKKKSRLRNLAPRRGRLVIGNG